MTTKISKLLECWGIFTTRSGILDKWKFKEDFSVNATLVRNNSNPKRKQTIINCRNIAISLNQNFEKLLKTIKYTLTFLSFSNSCLNINVQTYSLRQINLI